MRLLSRHSPAGLAALLLASLAAPLLASLAAPLLASLPGVPAILGMPLVPGVAGQEARAGDPGGASSPSFRGGLQVGSEAERYLRVLQVAGLTSPYPWSLRGFSPREAERVLPSPATLHPWQDSWSSPSSGRGRGRLGWVEPEIGILFNSTIPSGENDGALWAGKGFTTLARAGAWARLGPFHLRLAPEVFWTQNASFRLAPNGRTGEEALRDPRFPGDIDHPQRFGGWEYTRLDQSPYSPVQEGETRRFISGALLVLTPRGLPGLEVGAHRMVGTVWPQGGIGWADVGRPFRDVVSSLGEGRNPGNEHHLAGAFFRWVFPGAGFEMYAEVLREDFDRDLRHYIVEPDDLMARTFGFQRVWARQGGSLVALRGEVVSSELHHSQRRDRFRDGSTDPRPLSRYIHSGVRQGHTQHGQILGSPTAYGGSGWTLGVDRYGRRGRWSVDVSRALRLDWLPTVPGPLGVNRAEVGYTMRVEGVWRLGGVEWGAAAAPSWHLNRNLARGRDLFNLKMEVWGRGLPR